MSVKNRLTQFIDSNRISIREFEKSIGASNGYINSISRSVGIDKISAIIEKYPTLNIDWLMTGRGEMEFEIGNVEKNSSGNIAAEPKAAYRGGEWKNKYEQLNEKYTALLEQHNALLTNKLKEVLKDKSAV